MVETRLEGAASYYEVSPEPSHHHFVCTRCGMVGHFGDELLAPVHDELTRHDFAVGQIQVTAFGLCRECRQRRGRRTSGGGHRRPRLTSRTLTPMTPVAMHIPDGYLGPQTYVVLWLVMLPIWAVAARKVKRTLKTKQIPLLSLGAAFSFVIMMFNVPVIGGSTGHAVGATLIAILLGPWAAVIAISIALVVQAGLFGDGGITALAANCFTMAVVMPFAGYYVYRLLAGDHPSSARRIASAGGASYVAIVAGAVVAGVLFGIQPYLAHTASGQALYAPYRLDVAVPAMALEHLLFFGPIEALATMGVLAALARTQPELLAARPAARPLRWLWAGLALLLLLTPLGALAPGTAWGEWSGAQLKTALGYVPGNLDKLGGTWNAAMRGYATPGVAQHVHQLPARRHRRRSARRRHLLGGGGVPRAPPRRR